MKGSIGIFRSNLRFGGSCSMFINGEAHGPSKYQMASFGGRGDGLTQFNAPSS